MQLSICVKVWLRIGIGSGSVTPIDPIVTAATVLANPYTKEGVESLCILLCTSVNMCIINCQWLKFYAVNGQSPKISVVNGQSAEKSWSKFWPCVRSCDYRVYGSDTPLWFLLLWWYQFCVASLVAQITQTWDLQMIFCHFQVLWWLAGFATLPYQTKHCHTSATLLPYFRLLYFRFEVIWGYLGQNCHSKLHHHNNIYSCLDATLW